MDSHDQAMLDFATMWHHYGGADEQILPEFGLTPPAYYSRLLGILDGILGRGVDEQTRWDLEDFCRKKLSAYGVRTGRSLLTARPVTSTTVAFILILSVCRRRFRESQDAWSVCGR